MPPASVAPSYLRYEQQSQCYGGVAVLTVVTMWFDDSVIDASVCFRSGLFFFCPNLACDNGMEGLRKPFSALQLNLMPD